MSQEVDSPEASQGEPITVEDRQTEDGAEKDKPKLPISLTRVLFLACDTCIYCGGKFYN